MLDPASAIGLASSVVQLTTFIVNLVSTSHELYKSADGSLVRLTDLETTTSSLRSLTSNLSSKASSLHAETAPGTLDYDLQSLCNGSIAVADELLEATEKLKVQGRRKGWKSFRQALLSLWHEDKLDGLKERLNGFRDQINMILLLSLRLSVEELREKHNAHVEELRAKHDDNNVRSFRRFLIDELLGQGEHWSSQLLYSLFHNRWCEDNRQDVSSFSEHVHRFIKQDEELRRNADLVGSLQFYHMSDRYEAIPEAHQRTFEWIFRTHNEQPILENYDTPPSWDNFVDWLNGNQGLYWITGKPGAGKSTLMKFLFNDSRTTQYLSQWVDQHSAENHAPLVTAHFFFWNSGTTMQMSRNGLLRALLHQVLMTHATAFQVSLTARIFPDRWQRHYLFGGDPEPFSWPELAKALKLLVSDQSSRFFFVIDGLDEFDGNPFDLADLILDTSAQANVKICCASRPLSEFEDKFRDISRLRVQDLTKGDVYTFVFDRFHQSPRFCELQKVYPGEAESLIDGVTDKASGVFLWVELVVKSLEERLSHGADIAELMSVLLRLPTDLETLFNAMLDQIKPDYRCEGSRLFRVFAACRDPPTLLTLRLAEKHPRVDTVKSVETRPISGQELDFEADTMSRRLISRCRWFLEVSGKPPYHAYSRVIYLHRTVKDYFERDNIQRQLASQTSDFDPHQALCSSFLVQIKTFQFKYYMSDLVRFWTAVNNAVVYIKSWMSDNIDDKIAYLEELDGTATEIFQRPAEDSRYENWLHCIFRTYAPSGAKTRLWCNTIFIKGLSVPLPPGGDFHGNSSHFNDMKSFFEFCLRLGLFWYIDRQIQRNPDLINTFHHGVCLLSTALSLLDPPMVEVLLHCTSQHGSQAHLQEGWHYVYACLSDATPATVEYDHGNDERLVRIVLFFLRYGVEFEAKSAACQARAAVMAFLNQKQQHLSDQLFKEIVLQIDGSSRTVLGTTHRKGRGNIGPLPLVPLQEKSASFLTKYASGSSTTSPGPPKLPVQSRMAMRMGIIPNGSGNQGNRAKSRPGAVRSFRIQ